MRILSIGQPFFLRQISATPVVGVTLPNTLTVGTEVTASYTFASPTPEANEPPYARSLIISGTPTVGSTLTLTIDGLVIPNGKTAGTHIYRLYRCNNRQSVGTLIAGAVSSTYLLSATDDGRYIRGEVDLVQTAGSNTTSLETYCTTFSPQVTSSTFNPIAAIAWDSAFLHTDLIGFASDGIWPNSGTGVNAVRDGVANLPVYDSARGALEFTRASSQRLEITGQGQSQPIEVWIKFRLKSLPGNMQLIAWTSSMFIYVNNGGDLSVCGGTANTNLVINTDYVIRVLISGISTTVEVNHGAPIAVTTGVSINSLGSGGGRLGSSDATTPSNHLDGYEYDVFIKDIALSPTEQTNMWTWFGL